MRQSKILKLSSVRVLRYRCGTAAFDYLTAHKTENEENIPPQVLRVRFLQVVNALQKHVCKGMKLTKRHYRGYNDWTIAMRRQA